MFLESAKIGNNTWWIYLLTIVGVVLGYAFGQAPLFLAIFANNPGISEERLTQLVEKSDFKALGLENNLSFFLMLLSFVGAILVLWILVKALHKRSFKSLITPFEKINWEKVFFGFGLWMIFWVFDRRSVLFPQSGTLCFAVRVVKIFTAFVY